MGSIAKDAYLRRISCDRLITIPALYKVFLNLETGILIPR
jgi:hypothetical protein